MSWPRAQARWSHAAIRPVSGAQATMSCACPWESVTRNRHAVSLSALVQLYGSISKPFPLKTIRPVRTGAGQRRALRETPSLLNRSSSQAFNRRCAANVPAMNSGVTGARSACHERSQCPSEALLAVRLTRIDNSPMPRPSRSRRLSFRVVEPRSDRSRAPSDGRSCGRAMVVRRSWIAWFCCRPMPEDHGGCRRPPWLTASCTLGHCRAGVHG